MHAADCEAMYLNWPALIISAENILNNYSLPYCFYAQNTRERASRKFPLYRRLEQPRMRKLVYYNFLKYHV